MINFTKKFKNKNIYINLIMKFLNKFIKLCIVRVGEQKYNSLSNFYLINFLEKCISSISLFFNILIFKFINILKVEYFFFNLKKDKFFKHYVNNNFYNIFPLFFRIHLALERYKLELEEKKKKKENSSYVISIYNKFLLMFFNILETRPKFNEELFNKFKIPTESELKTFHLNSFILKNRFFINLKINSAFIKFFKFKLLFFKFFKINNILNLGIKYVQTKKLNNISRSKAFNFSLVKKYKGFCKSFKSFKLKYKKMLLGLNYISDMKSRLLLKGHYLKKSDYILLQYYSLLKKQIKKKIFLVTSGRYLIKNFRYKLGSELLNNFTKYKLKFRISNYILNFFKYFIKKNKIKKITKLLKKTEFKSVKKSQNFFIKKPANKLISNGRKKYGWNVYNNIFFIFNKLFKVKTVKHYEVINRIFKKLLIRSAIQSTSLAGRKASLRQECTVLLNFSEIKSRINLFFYDTFGSICRKKNKTFRLRKMQDLIALDFLKLISKNLKNIKTTHFYKFYIELNNFMSKEFKFRGFFTFYRNRIFKGLNIKKKRVFRFRKRKKKYLNFHVRKKIYRYSFHKKNKKTM